MRPDLVYCCRRKKWTLSLLAIILQACYSIATSAADDSSMAKRVPSRQGNESKEISVRVDRAASAAPLYQAQPLHKYFSRARTAAVAAGGGYGSSIGAARYYASGVPSKQSQQLHSFQMSSPSKTGSSMAGDSYGSGYWSGTNYNGGVEMPEMQWNMGGQGAYGSLLQPQEQQPIYPTATAGGYGALTNMGGGAPASPYAGYLEKQPTSLSYQAMSLGNSNCRWTCSTSPMPLPSHISSCVDNILEVPPICLNFTRMGS